MWGIRTTQFPSFGATALVLGLALVTSCNLFTSFDGLSSGGAGPTPGDDAGPVSDARATDATDDGTATTSRAWRQLTIDGPPALHSARMAFDEAGGKAVLYGGGNAGATTDTWQFDGAAWTRTVLPSTPGARNSPGIAYDSARKLTMLFGGSGAGPDPWEFDGALWKSSGVSASWPQVAYSSVMTYDRARNVLVVFGGVRNTSTADSGDTWEWSATAGWVQRTPAVSPPPRHGHVLVYDVARARVVLFGGADGLPRNDLWEWDGTTWEEKKPLLAPTGRRGACAAYDSTRKVTVVFGGRPDQTTQAFGETWEWDGTSWRAGASGPPARASCAMTFDSVRNRLVMLGGSKRRVNKNPPELVDGATWVYE
jgi:hypothetical protein